ERPRGGEAARRSPVARNGAAVKLRAGGEPSAPAKRRPCGRIVFDNDRSAALGLAAPPDPRLLMQGPCAVVQRGASCGARAPPPRRACVDQRAINIIEQ